MDAKANLKRIKAEFFKTAAKNEPVRDLLHRFGRPIKTQIGEDIRFVEMNWRVDRPYVDQLRAGSGEYEKTIYEARHKVEEEQFRTLFFVYEDRMILTHLFQKKSKKTPKSEIDVAWDRMKQWVGEQKALEASVKKKGRKK